MEFNQPNIMPNDNEEEQTEHHDPVESLADIPQDDTKKTVELLREISIQISKDPSARERMIRAISGDTKQAVLRATVGLRGNSLPYYKEHYALELQPYLDMMIAQQKAIEFKYANYKHLGKKTLRLKIYQAFLYLVDNLDPSGKYFELKNQTMVLLKQHGVRISFVDKIKIPLHGAIVEDDEAGSGRVTPFWKDKVDEFVSTAPVGEKLRIAGLKLSDTEVAELEASFVGITGVIARITNSKIELFKIDPDKLAEAE